MFLLLIVFLITVYFLGTGLSLAFFESNAKHKKMAYPLAFVWFISIPMSYITKYTKQK